MSVKEALGDLRCGGTVIMFKSQAQVLAPKIEKALDATIDAFVEAYNFTGPMPDDARKAWHDVFVAAMMEGE